MAALIPFLALFTENTRLAYPFIQSLVEQGLNNNAIIRSLQDAGLGARAADVRALATYLRDGLTKTDYLRKLERNVIPSLEDYNIALHKIRRQFTHIVKLVGTDPFTGEPVTKHISVSTDKRWSRGQAEKEALKLQRETDTPLITDITDVEWVKAFIAGPEGTL